MESSLMIPNPLCIHTTFHSRFYISSGTELKKYKECQKIFILTLDFSAQNLKNPNSSVTMVTSLLHRFRHSFFMCFVTADSKLPAKYKIHFIQVQPHY